LIVDPKDCRDKGSIVIALVLILFLLIFICFCCAVEVAEQASEQETSFHLRKLKWLNKQGKLYDFDSYSCVFSKNLGASGNYIPEIFINCQWFKKLVLLVILMLSASFVKISITIFHKADDFLLAVM